MPISDAITDVITDVITDAIGTGGEPPINLYPNFQWAGGYPPTNHTFAFNDIAGRMNDNGDGTFDFESNFNEDAGRNTIQWDLSTAVLEPGKRYRMSYTVEKLNPTNYGAALFINNAIGIDIHSQSLNAIGLGTKEIFMEFTPVNGYTATIRIGCGTTAVNSAWLIYSDPSIFEV